MSRITLSNQTITAQIDTLGAELKSIRDAKGIERLWSGNPDIWSGQAPILFPIAGGLKEDRFTHQGQSYTLPKHGFAKLTEFEVEAQTADSATFLLRDSEATRVQYPFAFEFRAIYTLTGESVRVDYEVKNTGSDTMYFSVGAHEAYACPEGIEAYEVVFDQAETAEAYVLNGNLLSGEHIPMLKDQTVFPLKNDYFKVDALVFLDIKSRGVTLRSKAHGRTLRVDFPNHDYFLLWTKFNAPYICIEPWCGIQDFEGTGFELSEKRGILSLAAGGCTTRSHTITV